VFYSGMVRARAVRLCDDRRDDPSGTTSEAIQKRAPGALMKSVILETAMETIFSSIFLLGLRKVSTGMTVLWPETDIICAD